MKLRMFSLLLVIAAITAACGAGATATPVPIDDPTPTATPAPTPTPDTYPLWLTALIASFEDDDVANPPVKISEYVYNGATVYFVPQRCCDIFSDLYDGSGLLIAHPDGGITGMGDGKAPDFSTSATFVGVVWEDPRGQRELVRAPIESVEILVIESFPVQYRLHVVSGLPNSGARFDHWNVDLNEAARLFTIEVLNDVPKPTAAVACAMLYGMIDHSIPLENVTAGQTYKVQVHDKATEFTAQ
ncbi:MAG: hypothetical protein O2826_02375 [Chloroflexi bacterium]|nr:hypothetical protein [Chloroflexota bacterium]MDA1173344.1 hypothetical protein [Chloroflexota bacterium]